MSLRMRCGCDEVIEVDASGGDVRCPRCGLVHRVVASRSTSAPEEKVFPCERCGERFPFAAMIKHQGRRLCRPCFAAGSSRALLGTGWRRAAVVALLLVVGAGVGGFAVLTLTERSHQAPPETRAETPTQAPAPTGSTATAPTPIPKRPAQEPAAATADPPPKPSPAEDTGSAPTPSVAEGRPAPSPIPADRTALLIATEAGRAALRVGDEWSTIDATTLGIDAVRWVHIDHEGRAWFAGDGAVVCCAGDELRRYGADTGVPDAPISRVFEDATGRIWISSWGKGIAYLALDRWRRLSVGDGLCHDEANDFALAWHGTVWVGTDQGISVLRDLEFLGGAAVQQLAALDVKSATSDPSGVVFLGCTTGLLIIAPNMTFKWITPQQGLPQRTPQALLLDSRARLWAGTWGGGVVRVDTAALAVAPTDAEPRMGAVGRLCEDGAQRIWAASLDTGLWYHDPDGWKRVAVPPGFESLRVVGALPEALARTLMAGESRVVAAPPSSQASAVPVERAATDPVEAAMRVRNEWAERVLVTIAGGAPFWLAPGEERGIEMQAAWYSVRLSRDDGGYTATTHPVFPGGLWSIQADPAGSALPRINVNAQAAGAVAVDAPSLRMRVVNEIEGEVTLRIGDTGVYHCLAAGGKLDLTLADAPVVAVLAEGDDQGDYQVTRPRADADWVIRRTPQTGRIGLAPRAREPNGTPSDAVDLAPSTAASARLDSLLASAPSGRLRVLATGQKIEAAAFTADGASLVVAMRDGQLVAWDVVTGDERWRRPCRDVVTICVSRAGWIWTADRRGHRLARHDPRTGRETGGVRQRQLWANAVAFTADGRRAVLVIDSGGLFVFDLTDGTLGPRLGGDGEAATRCAALDPLGQLAAEGSNAGTIRVWDLASGKTSGTVTGHQGWVNAIAFSPDGRRAVSADGHYQSGGVQSLGSSSGGPHAGGSLRLWDPSAPSTSFELGRHAAPVSRVVLSDDGRLVLSAGYDGRAFVWDVEQRTKKATLDPSDGPVLDVGFGARGRLAFTVSAGGSVLLWRLGDA